MTIDGVPVDDVTDQNSCRHRGPGRAHVHPYAALPGQADGANRRPELEQLHRSPAPEGDESRAEAESLAGSAQAAPSAHTDLWAQSDISAPSLPSGPRRGMRLRREKMT